MAKTKATGTSRLGRDSISKRLGVKLFSGQMTKPGSIIVRQRGIKFLAGENVRVGSDDTLYSIVKGTVKFKIKKKVKFDGRKRKTKVVSVEPF